MESKTEKRIKPIFGIIPEKMEISVSLEKYALFSSNSEVTFTVKGFDHQEIIDQLLDAIKYFSDQYQGLVKLE